MNSVQILMDHKHYSTTYGINCDLIFNNSRYFYVLVPDVMHDVLEGALELEVKQLLKHFIGRKSISLSILNDAIEASLMWVQMLATTVADLGFGQGGFCYSIVREARARNCDYAHFLLNHTHFRAFWRETSCFTCQSVFDQDLCYGMLR